MGNRIEGDVFVAGTLSATAVILPDSTLTNAKVAPGAGIAANKNQQQIKKSHSQPNTTATTETRPLHIVVGATGLLQDFRAGSIVAALGGATVTIDLKKNGTSVLAGGTPITLNSSSDARVSQTGTLAATPTVAVGDFFEVVITATAGGGTLPTGIFCQLTLNEDPI